jgi:regulator of replication initiation timing
MSESIWPPYSDREGEMLDEIQELKDRLYDAETQIYDLEIKLDKAEGETRAQLLEAAALRAELDEGLPKPQWTKITDDPKSWPLERQRVLIFLRNKTIIIGHFENTWLLDDFYRAWMPLPEPYRGEE